MVMPADWRKAYPGNNLLAIAADAVRLYIASRAAIAFGSQ
jgi:hypothetical protein